MKKWINIWSLKWNVCYYFYYLYELYNLKHWTKWMLWNLPLKNFKVEKIIFYLKSHGRRWKCRKGTNSCESLKNLQRSIHCMWLYSCLRKLSINFLPGFRFLFGVLWLLGPIVSSVLMDSELNYVPATSRSIISNGEKFLHKSTSSNHGNLICPRSLYSDFFRG